MRQSWVDLCTTILVVGGQYTQQNSYNMEYRAQELNVMMQVKLIRTLTEKIWWNMMEYFLIKSSI